MVTARRASIEKIMTKLTELFLFFIRLYLLPTTADASKWYAWQLRCLPVTGWREPPPPGIDDSFLFLPHFGEHDSGYSFIRCVVTREGVPLCALTTHSDVLHVDGIGGYGPRDGRESLPDKLPICGWSIDCFPRSGAFRIWPNSSNRIEYGNALSSFEFYAVRKEKK